MRDKSDPPLDDGERTPAARQRLTKRQILAEAFEAANRLDVDEPLLVARPPHEDQLFRWAMASGLDHVVRFHNSLQTLLREKYNAPEVAEERGARAVIEAYDRMNSTNSFLVAFAFLEEMLFSLWKWRAPSLDLPRGGAVLERYKPLFKHLGIDIGSLGAWTFVADANAIRNCLLHANGRVSFMADADDLRKRIARYGDDLSLTSDRLLVPSQFLHRLVAAIRELRDVVLAAGRSTDVASPPSSPPELSTGTTPADPAARS